jgi:hypothetical protein
MQGNCKDELCDMRGWVNFSVVSLISKDSCLKPDVAAEVCLFNLLVQC